jgi:hypothetical protein
MKGQTPPTRRAHGFRFAAEYRSGSPSQARTGACQRKHAERGTSRSKRKAHGRAHLAADWHQGRVAGLRRHPPARQCDRAAVHARSMAGPSPVSTNANRDARAHDRPLLAGGSSCPAARGERSAPQTVTGCDYGRPHAAASEDHRPGTCPGARQAGLAGRCPERLARPPQASCSGWPGDRSAACWGNDRTRPPTVDSESGRRHRRRTAEGAVTR